jgi:hypothetical protein
MQHRTKLDTQLLEYNVKRREHSEDLGVDGKIILERILGKQGGKIWTGCVSLRTGISGGLLRTR